MSKPAIGRPRTPALSRRPVMMLPRTNCPLRPAFLPWALLLSATVLWTSGCSRPADGAENNQSAGGEENAENEGGTKERKPLVAVQAVEIREVRRELETTGSLEANHQVTVSPRVGGRVLEVLVDEGDTVSAKQVLAELDDRQVAATRRQADAQFKDAEVRERLALLEVEASTRRLEQASIDERQAKAEFERQSQIDPTLVAPKILQDAGFALQNATQARLLSEFNERKAKLDASAAAIAVTQARARLDEIDVQLEDHRIRSPVAGVVVERMIKGGESIGAATELFVVADTSSLLSYLTRPQLQLPLVANAKDVEFTADAYPNRDFKGVVDKISPVIDQTTGHFKIRVRVTDPEQELLRPGMFIRARIIAESGRMGLLVPKAAVLADGDEQIVFALRSDTAVRIVIDPGIEQQDWLECRNRGKGGLMDDDLVIVTGQSNLEDGEAVEVYRPQATGSEQASSKSSTDSSAAIGGGSAHGSPSSGGADRAKTGAASERKSDGGTPKDGGTTEPPQGSRPQPPK